MYDFLNPLELLIQEESNQHVSRITLNTQTHQNVHNTHFKGFELCHKYQETTKQELRKLHITFGIQGKGRVEKITKKLRLSHCRH